MTEELGRQLRRYATSIWRHRWQEVAIVWVVCVAGWIGVSLIPDQYEASTRVYVDADAVLTPLLRGLALDDTAAGQLEVLQRTLLSRPNLERLVAKTDLELTVDTPADLEALVTRLTTDIKLTPQTKNLFVISYRNSSPKLAYDVVQIILTMFIESPLRNSFSDMKKAEWFLDQQIGISERRLQGAETKQRDFRAKYGDLLPGDGAVPGPTKLEKTRALIATLRGQVQDLTSRREMLTMEMGLTPQQAPGTAAAAPSGASVGKGGVGEGGGGTNAEVAAAEKALWDLRLLYTDEHPDVIAAKARLAALKSRHIPAAATRLAAPAAPGAPAVAHGALNPAYELLRMRLAENEVAIAAVNRQIADATADVDRMEALARATPDMLDDYANITRDYNAIHRTFETMLDRRESMQIAAAANVDVDKNKLDIVDPPKVPQNPIGPKRVLLMSGVLVAGLFCGLAIGIIYGQFDKSFYCVNDLRDFGLPVIGGIMLLKNALPRHRSLTAAMTLAFALLLLCLVYAGLIWRVLKIAPGIA
jgi:polysaccharide chain length determinant protein (PEP-CTERM system associated)